MPNLSALGVLGLFLLALAGCNMGPGLGARQDAHSSPFAPNSRAGAQGEDPKIVGYRLMEAGENELALKAFQRAAATEGLTTELLSAFGTVNLQMGRLGQAEGLMRRATEADDARPEDWNNLGVVLLEKGETAEAVLVMRKAFALSNGEATEIRDNLRLALAKMENRSYAESSEQNYKLVRRGSSDFVIRKTPG